MLRVNPRWLAPLVGAALVLAAGARAEGRYIGTATMAADRTVTLWLRADLPGDAGHGHATLLYPQSDPQYREILCHLGGLRPGETKAVKPWPDDPNPASQSCTASRRRGGRD
ncbi:MAG TPA: hypothetical protein VII63_03130 [Caulobacteraceae bacterium]